MLRVKILLRMIGMFAFGAVGYPLLELLWRGESHILMALAGGICFLAIYAISLLPKRKVPLILKCLLGALVITAVELAIGLIANLHFGMDIWDYSHLPLNFKGQICLLFSGVWFLICIPMTLLCGLLRRSFSRSDRRYWV